MLFRSIFTRNLVGDFQYFGIWLMLCFILQSLLTYKILRLFQQDRLCLYLGTISISLVPFWLEKTSIHFSLSGHFLILSAIYLVLNDREPSKFEGFKWRVLLFAALGIHAYIFAMILPFYLVSIANKFLSIRKISR